LSDAAAKRPGAAREKLAVVCLSTASPLAKDKKLKSRQPTIQVAEIAEEEKSPKKCMNESD
jgi:hypothetical protein